MPEINDTTEAEDLQRMEEEYFQMYVNLMEQDSPLDSLTDQEIYEREIDPVLEQLRSNVNGLAATDYPYATNDIDSPDHYTAGGIEAIDVIRAKLTPEEYRGYLKGSSLKYLLRANFKGQHDKDVHKAVWFVDELFNVTPEA